MNFLAGIVNGLREIWSHKLRSALTMMCILLGVGSVVLTVGFVNGLFSNWNRWLAESGGLEKIAVLEQPAPEAQQAIKARSPGRTMNDVQALSEGARHIALISPEMDLDSRFQRGRVTQRARAQGVTPAIFVINRLEVEHGRAVTDLDVQRASSVVVLGSTVARKLFKPDEDPLGATVRVNGLLCEVVGVLRRYAMKADPEEWNPLEGLKNNIAFLPITTMQRKLVGDIPLTWLNVQVRDVRRLHDAVGEMQNIVRASHRGIEDFRVKTGEEDLQELQSMQRNFMVVGTTIGAVTLVIGGIGIMNLMLASINERVREIGIRKALGAWDEDVFLQFMAESVALSLVGGAIGVAAGCGLIEIMQRMPSFTVKPEISLTAVVVGFSFSVVTGILSGIYPAILASRLDPIEALRFE
jgi:putative ABC transport system permease protein